MLIHLIWTLNDQKNTYRLEAQIKNGKFDPIPITLYEYQNGILSEGKHRLIIAKKLKIDKIPIQFP